ncbi:membrane protein insertion efficiency factor YidD [Candidatus Foliamicus sp.]
MAHQTAALVKFIAIKLIRAYQLCISPYLGPRCRFQPTCSQYALEAIEVHGLLRGIGMSARRLLRCHPLGPSGWDPIPQPDAEVDRAPSR